MDFRNVCFGKQGFNHLPSTICPSFGALDNLTMSAIDDNISMIGRGFLLELVSNGRLVSPLLRLLLSEEFRKSVARLSNFDRNRSFTEDELAKLSSEPVRTPKCDKFDEMLVIVRWGFVTETLMLVEANRVASLVTYDIIFTNVLLVLDESTTLVQL